MKAKLWFLRDGWRCVKLSEIRPLIEGEADGTAYFLTRSTAQAHATGQRIVVEELA